MHRRSSGLARWQVLTVIWGLATLVGLLVARFTKVGPVLLVFVQGHGVHLGDVAAFVVCYAAAAVTTLRTRH